MKEKRRMFGTFRKLMHVLANFRIELCLMLTAATASVFLSLWMLRLTGEAVDIIADRSGVHIESLWHVMYVMVGVLLGCAGLQWVLGISGNRLVNGAAAMLRKQTSERLTRISVRGAESWPQGDMISRMTSDVDQIADGLLMGMSQLFTGVLTIIATLWFMGSENLLLMAVVVVLTPVSIGVARFLAGTIHRLFRDQAEKRSKYTQIAEEIISQKEIVQAFTYDTAACQRFEEASEAFRKASAKASFVSSLVNPATRFVNGIIYAFVGTAGAWMVVHGDISVGVLTVFLGYASQYAKPFNEISGVMTELQNALACAERVFELAETEMEDEETGEALSDENGTLQFQSVGFSYHPEHPVLTDVTFSVRPGQRVAIVGPTGCGKTTLISLLMRFYDPDQGEILLGGKNILRMKRRDVRRHTGMVLQEPWIQEGTVRQNICMGRNLSDAEIIDAARRAHLHPVILRLPEGYDTVIHEDDVHLSQGEKQLLCIARVMAGNPPFLVLDEATSSVDTRTEQMIQKAFRDMMKGRTSLIIAHRLQTIRDADLILVMKDGRIAEQGTHEVLMAEGGHYAEMFRSQFHEGA